MLSKVFNSDVPDFESRFKRPSGHDGIDLFTQNSDGNALNIQIHIIRIAGTSKKEPEIAAAFQSPFFFVQLPADMVEHNQMENLNGLPYFQGDYVPIS
jgi:hypothetical protein